MDNPVGVGGVRTTAGTGLDALADLYGRWGSDHYDEEMSQLDHALQTAARAVAEHADDALVAAALLHDVGHLLALERDGAAPAVIDARHELVGARYLAGLFPPTVTAPVALHVQAKRYRCAVDVRYHEHLSDGSRRSLERQGGPFSTAEGRAFRAHPASAAALRLRRWDDDGKVVGSSVLPFASYRPVLERLVTSPSS